MTTRQLLALTDDEIAALDPAIIDRVRQRELEKLERLQRRLHHLHDEARPKTLTEVGERLGISGERVRQLEKIAILKIRRNYPELSDLLK